ncbi:MAG: hypothetical protein ACLU6W_09950 [Lachnospiraceae bacterium]
MWRKARTPWFEKADGTISCRSTKRRQKNELPDRTLLEGQEEAVETVQTADGQRRCFVTPEERWTGRCTDPYRIRISEEECLYGLGQHQQGVLNLRGTMQYLHLVPTENRRSDAAFSKGYGIL